MTTTTYYYNSNGEQIKKHNGEPRQAHVFLKNAADAVRIEISTVSAFGYGSKNFYKVDGRWVGDIYETTRGYSREVLVSKVSRMHRLVESVSKEEAEAIIAESVKRVMDKARNAIRWCDPADANDPDGRYWLSAYAGAQVYRLIVQNGRIVGSIPGGFYESRSVRCPDLVWTKAIRDAVAEKMTGDYQLLKADGSGTYFYLRNQEDAKYLEVKEYDVPSVKGGMHHNIEVR